MRIFDRIVWVAAFMGSAAMGTGVETGPHLGNPIAQQQVSPVDLTITPDGAGLPAGKGSAGQGLALYDQHCAACHGKAGKGGIGAMPRLTGGIGTLASSRPIKTVNSYWPQAPGIFDYIRRSMPPTAPQSLTADQVYSIIAYLLSIDGIIAPTAKLTRESLRKIKMPNRDGFISCWGEKMSISNCL